jgi:hypothetical protein
MFGKIHHYIHWGYTYNMYKSDKMQNLELLDKYELIKVWSGR